MGDLGRDLCTPLPIMLSPTEFTQQPPQGCQPSDDTISHAWHITRYLCTGSIPNSAMPTKDKLLMQKRN